MRSNPILALTCIAAVFGSAAADDTARPDPHASNLDIEMERDDLVAWRDRAGGPRDGRLSYLHASRCAPACTARSPRIDIAERDYIDALTLGSYGSMDLKFTGDRVKLKVRF